jgi:hypothetical protein
MNPKLDQHMKKPKKNIIISLPINLISFINDELLDLHFSSPTISK